MLGSLAVSAFTGFGTNQGAMDYLTITRYRVIDGHFAWESGLPEISAGQIWRLFTPFFIHFGIGHLLINFLGAFIFGTLIEKRQGILTVLSLVLAIAIVSNLTQYFVRGPAFGGMSAVMDGLFGYCVTRAFLDPASGLQVDKLVVFWCGIFAVATALGLFKNTAQVCHATGLAAGIIWGVASGLRARKRSSKA